MNAYSHLIEEADEKMALKAKPEDKKRLPAKGGVEVSPITATEKWNNYPSRALTPTALVTYIEEADGGNLTNLMEFFEEMEEKDAHYASVLQTRKLSVVACDWEILPTAKDKDNKAEVDRAEEVALFVREALEELPRFDEALLDLLDGIAKGFAVEEIMWVIKEGKVVPSELLWRHQRRFCIDDEFKYKLVTSSVPYPGVALPDNKFIIHQPRSKSGYATRAGVGRVCAFLYLFANYALKDWVQFTEIFGMPLRIGTYQANSQTAAADRQNLRRALTQLGTAAAVAISDDMAIDIKGTGGSGTQSGAGPFPGLISTCHRLISKAVLGQTLTTEESQRGTQALGTVHENVRQDILEADAKAISSTITNQLVALMVLFNYGPDVPIPKFWVNAAAEKDLQAMAEVDKILVKDCGVHLSQEYFYEMYARPAPGDGETIVSPPGGSGTASAVPSSLPEMGMGQPTEDDFSALEVELEAQSTTIQTLIFDKEKFPTEASVRAWVKAHGFKVIE